MLVRGGGDEPARLVSPEGVGIRSRVARVRRRRLLPRAGPPGHPGGLRGRGEPAGGAGGRRRAGGPHARAALGRALEPWRPGGDGRRALDPVRPRADRGGGGRDALDRVDRPRGAGAVGDAVLGARLLHGAATRRRGAHAGLGQLGPPGHVLVLLGAVGGVAARHRCRARGPLRAPGRRRARGLGHPTAVDERARSPLPLGPGRVLAALALVGRRARAAERRGERLLRAGLAARPVGTGGARRRAPGVHLAPRRAVRGRRAGARERERRRRRATLRRGGGRVRA